MTSPGLAVLRWLARRTSATASELGDACAMPPGEVRARLVTLESRRLVGSRSDKAVDKLRRVYFVIAEGRRAAGVGDARTTEIRA